MTIGEFITKMNELGVPGDHKFCIEVWGGLGGKGVPVESYYQGFDWEMNKLIVATARRLEYFRTRSERKQEDAQREAMLYSASTPRWVTFEEQLPLPGRTTKRWLVRSKQGEGFILGEVSFHAHWRKYIFSPAAPTMFDDQCLREVAAFVRHQTFLQNESSRKAREKKKATSQ